MAEIKQEKTLAQLLQEIRCIISKTELKKSGYNSFSKFSYFELKDFLPLATRLFAEAGICPIFSIAYENEIEYAYLTLTKGTQQIMFKSPTAEANNSNNPIQNLGSKHTYMRRYLYLNALDLVENDSVDSQDNTKLEKKEEPKKTADDTKATESQLDHIRNMYDEENIAKMLEYFKVKKLEDLSIKQASFVISKKLKEEMK